MTNRVINFNPGPATMPLAALELAQKEFLDFEGTGMSILEHSHRAKPYEAVHAEAKNSLREIAKIPESHEILFMQGGASAQFALVPLNLCGPEDRADYVITGAWSEKAISEAKLICKPNVACTTKEGETFRRVPAQSELKLDPTARFVHITTNNTIFGSQFHTYPKTGSVPLVADMSSDILWRPTDFSEFGLAYAGAQKNIGPAGITVVIIRKDLIPARRDNLSKCFRYQTFAAEDSLQNTIPTFGMYLVRNVMRWIKFTGGLEAVEKRNRKKAELVYGAIDARPDFYRAPVEKTSRSVMNVVFRLPSEELEAKFVSEATKAGLVGLKGHRSAGGIRVSMYNALEIEGVQTLVSFMDSFARRS